MDNLIAGFRRFRHDVFPTHKALFEALAHGQHPEVLFVTCSDSRIDPELLTQSPPGRMFVLRNAGNLIPPQHAQAGGEVATLHYAVETLKVHHIVVCGHIGCGAMDAIVSGQPLPDVLGQWLRHAGPVGPLSGGVAALAVELNVQQQLANLRTHAFVAEAELEGALQLHGWVYDIPRGEVKALDATRKEFRCLEEVHEEEALVHELTGAAMPVEDGWIDHGPWSVRLLDAGRDPEPAAAAVAQVTGLSVHAARVLIQTLPCLLLDGLTHEEALLVEAWLQDADATVSLDEAQPRSP
jgi:carbonic anhydrase